MKTGIISRILSRLFERRDIVNCARELYLQRWFVIRLEERLAIFVHRFQRSDEDRALHDHPWDFIVIPLWRGYIEHSSCQGCQNYPEYSENQTCPNPQQRRVYPIIGTRIRHAEYRHRVELIDGRPAWSLFIRFRRRREWGFWLPEGFKLWNRWWQEKCE